VRLHVTQGKWINAANLAWTILAGALAVHAILFPDSHSVYPIYSSASRSWLAGQDMYVVVADYYRCSPLFAIALTPFALLPDCLGGALWKAFNLAIYVLPICGLGSPLWSGDRDAHLCSRSARGGVVINRRHSSKDRRADIHGVKSKLVDDGAACD
jgi:hypothetical protein